jgi:hypothetical protein
MITRKNGETHTQYIQRLSAALDSVVASNRALRTVLAGEDLKVNPRTGATYKSEAEMLFTGLVLAEQQLRLENPEFVKMLLQECIQRMDFTMVDIYDNSLANNPGKYNETK